MALQPLIDGIALAGLTLFVRAIVASLLIAPMLYFVNGLAGIQLGFVGLVMSSIAWLWVGRNLVLSLWQTWIALCIVDIVYGLSYGLLLSGQVDVYPPREAAIQIALSLLFGSLSLGWVLATIRLEPLSANALGNHKPVNAYMLGITLSFGALFPLFGRVSSYQQLLENFGAAEKLGVAVAAAGSLYLAYAVGRVAGNATKLLSSAGYGILREVITLGAAGGFFLVGYLLIATEFASVYAVIWKSDVGSFSGDGLPKDASWFDFFYFSVITIATVGYGDIVPHSKSARVATICEVVLGMAWVTLVVTATVSRLSTRGKPPCNSDA